MLVLSRKIGERIVIEPGIEIEIVEVRGGKVRIGIEAPKDIRIFRSEIAERSLPELLLAAPAHSR
jgi:carbon storage regulator